MMSSQAISRKLHSPDYKEKYKTELCRNWLSGYCSFDNKCVFAHGNEELRDKTMNSAEEIALDTTQETENYGSPETARGKRLPVFEELSRRISKDSD